MFPPLIGDLPDRPEPVVPIRPSSRMLLRAYGVGLLDSA